MGTSANPTKAWTKLLGTSANDSAYALTTGADGAIYMAGYTEGSLDGQTYSGGKDAFITKYNPDGSKVWTRLLGTRSEDYAQALTTGADGAIYMAGYTEGSLDGQTYSGGKDAFITKYNSDGSKVWTRLLGTRSEDYAQALTTGADGAIYMAGYTEDGLDGQTYSGGKDAFITKYNSDGSKVWTRLLGTRSEDYAQALTTGADGAIYMAGYTEGSLDGQTNSGGGDAFLARYDASGNKAWTRLLGTNSLDWANALTIDTDGAIYIAGWTEGNLDGHNNSGGQDSFLTKYDANGNKAWTRLQGSSSFDAGRALTTGTDGAIYIAGWTDGSLDRQNNSGGQDSFLTKYDANGNKAWTRLQGSSSFDAGRALTTGTDGAIYIAGYSRGLDVQANSGGYDAFLTKWIVDGSGPLVPTVEFSTTSSSANEGNSGKTKFTIQAKLNAATSETVTIPISISGTATFGTDYGRSLSGISIRAGSTSGLGAFEVWGDLTVESNESVIFTMGTPINATLGTNTIYTHTIVNDDPNASTTTGIDYINGTADADTTPPTIIITSSTTRLKGGETAAISFTLSEPADDFFLWDVSLTGRGTLTNFLPTYNANGSGSINYVAYFTPPPIGEGSSVISVGNFKFSDAARNANQDGADANNRVELTYYTVGPTITVTSNKTYLGLGESAIVSFSLSEPSTDFTVEDITTTNGTLIGFSGSGKSYSATFVPSGIDVGLITVYGYRFSDVFGNQNNQITQLAITPFDPSRGNVQWTKLLGTSGNDTGRALTTGADGAIFIAGSTDGSLDGQTPSGNPDIFLTKYDANGSKAWTRLLGTSSSNYANALTTGTDGAIYIAGFTGGSLDGQTYSGSGDAFLTKYDANGTKAWTRLLGSDSKGQANALTTGKDGAIYIAGYDDGSLDGQTNKGYSDAFLTKYKPDGTKAWSRLYGTSSPDQANALTTGADGAIYIAGYTEGSLDGQTYSGGKDAFITKYNPDGSKVWTRLLGTRSEDYAQALTTGADGAIYMAGYTEGSLDGQTYSGGKDAFITKYNSDGSKVWTRLLGTRSEDYAQALTTGADGAIYMAGYTEDGLDGQTYSGGKDAFITKYNPDGSKVWTKLLGTSAYDSAYALTTGADGAIYMAGTTDVSLDGKSYLFDFDAFLAKFVVPDNAIPTIALQADKTSVTAGGSVAITFTLSKPSTNFIASDVTVVNGVLSNFSGSGNTYKATFTPTLGAATASLSVESRKFSEAFGNFNDDGTEANNTVTISISGSTPSTPLIQFSNTSSSANEGSTGSTTVTVQATLSAASSQSVTVPITYSGTATQGTDYTNATASISIPSGQTTGTATFSILGDTNVEPNETVILSMGTPTNATLGTNKVYTHTVLNDDLDQQVVSRTNALTVLVDKGILKSNPVLLKDLVEEITTTGTAVTSHTVSYEGTKFKYSDIDALITTVIRDGEFTDEFRKEIADAHPSYDVITYKEAISLVGAANIDSILISVAGADGNYVV